MMLKRCVERVASLRERGLGEALMSLIGLTISCIKSIKCPFVVFFTLIITCLLLADTKERMYLCCGKEVFYITFLIIMQIRQWLYVILFIVVFSACSDNNT